MGIIHASGLWSFVYIPLTSKQDKFQPQTDIFLVEKAYCCVGKDSEKSINFFGLRSCYHRQANRKKIYFATKKILQNFEGHDHWHWQFITFSAKVGEIKFLKYGNQQGIF